MFSWLRRRRRALRRFEVLELRPDDSIILVARDNHWELEQLLWLRDTLGLELGRRVIVIPPFDLAAIRGLELVARTA